jgi:hypothetical protein
LQAHKKAMRAGIPEETQRAWLIVERDWIRMAEREAVKLDDGGSRFHWVDNAARSSNAWRELEGAVQENAPSLPEDTRRVSGDDAGRP